MERLLLVIFVSIYSHTLQAYGIISHKEIAKETITQSVIPGSASTQDGASLNQFYIDTLNIDTTKLYSYLITRKTVEEWIAQGSQDEDSTEQFYRPINHFFDPQHGDSLWDGLNRRYGLKFPQTVFETALGASNKATDWALEDYSEFGQQEYSLKDAQDALYEVLTTTNIGTGQGGRNWYIGKYFYSLGHVLHLLADMGQPEHVRIDQHLVLGDPEPIWVDRYLLKFYSLYEQYTDYESRRLMHDLPVLASRTSTPYPYRPADIKSARDLWFDPWSSITTEKGLSVFTNNNFVSNDTNFDIDYYQSPVRNVEETCKPLNQLLVSGATAPIDPRVGELSGDVCFVSNNVTDRNQSNLTAINNRAASLSIFNAEVELYHDDCLTISNAEFDSSQLVINGCKKYTMNRWNFDSAHAFLMPRIVGYGNALLEHLYRGRMEILPPTAAQALDFQAAPLVKGVSQLPIMLKNTTPNEAMVPGKLVAVITYVNGNNEVVEVITSDEVTGAPPSTTSQPFTFNFTERAFPVNIDGLTAYIQVIFRGQLGDDKDTIVVVRKPLSEIIQPFTLTADVPDSGVYAAIDHSKVDMNFTSLTMKLSSAVQIDGTLVPSASYHKDNCLSYYINCNGSYNRTTESFISVSNAFPADALNLPMTMTFANGIPPNATDLFLNFINFKTDPTQPVGVAFVDISEPTVISVINNTDYYSYDGTYQTIDALRSDPIAQLLLTNRNIKEEILTIHLAFPDGGFGYPDGGYLESYNLNPGTYSRMAILTKPGTFNLYYYTTGFNSDISGSYQSLNSAILQANLEAGVIEYGPVPYSKRGITSHHVLHFEYPAYLAEGDIQQITNSVGPAVPVNVHLSQ